MRGTHAARSRESVRPSALSPRRLAAAAKWRLRRGCRHGPRCRLAPAKRGGPGGSLGPCQLPIVRMEMMEEKNEEEPFASGTKCLVGPHMLWQQELYSRILGDASPPGPEGAAAILRAGGGERRRSLGAALAPAELRAGPPGRRREPPGSASLPHSRSPFSPGLPLLPPPPPPAPPTPGVSTSRPPPPEAPPTLPAPMPLAGAAFQGGMRRSDWLRRSTAAPPLLPAPLSPCPAAAAPPPPPGTARRAPPAPRAI
ncbi:basic proline-rich protein-like [Caloenas nicobarica]|uniref:basic proline-rich protein-like n=1 Tax=Caloenas nicobarica TaxID=187106 RepID=UPI0032B8089A